MWEGLITRPLDKWTAGKFLTFASAILVTTFSYLLLVAPIATADDHQAKWENANLVYDGITFEGPETADADNRRQLPEGTIYYYYEKKNMVFADEGHLLYFPPDSDVNTADRAQYMTYKHRDSNYYDYSDPRAVTIDTSTSEQADPEYTPGANGTVESCAIDGGLGWAICPLTNTLAKGMDWVFEALVMFLEVEPLSLDNDKNAMYEAWKIMRVFANIAFVIAFLIIIYSQLTSFGISNYGIKKIFPRLIVAAIFVNISYWLCAVAIDISNLLGAGMQSIFIDMRNYLVEDVGADATMLVSWESVTTSILSGVAITGVVVGGVTLAVANVAMASTGAVFLLLPILLSAFLTLLVVLLILAARQAIITILVVLSPLAFVAYLLPNTESWFEKWRSTMMTMLLLFPAFSIVFGGSQLAGLLIIMRALEDGNVVVMLLGMAVQVAPLAIVPLLLKLGGTLLTRIAGVVNNPNRGLIDRTRNWSNDRFEKSKAANMARNRTLANENPDKFKRSPLRRFGVHWDDMRRARDGQQKIDDQVADAMFTGSETGKALHEAEHSAHQLKERVDSEVGKHLQDKINTQGTKLHLENVNVEVAKAELATSKAKTDAQLEEYRTNSAKFAPWSENVDELKGAAKALQVSTEQLAVQGLRKQSATFVKNKDFAELMAIEDDDIANPRYTEAQNALHAAAGIDPGGRLRAQADAMSNLVKMEDEGLTKSLQLMNAQAIRQGTTLKDYTAKIAEIGMNGNRDKEGNTYNYDPVMIEAALEQQAKEGQVGVMENALRSEHIDHDSIMRVIARNGGTMKSKGGFHVQADPGKLSIHEIMKEIQAQEPGLGHSQVLKKAQDQFDMRIAFERMDVLATTGAEDISGFKVGYFNNVLAGEMENNIKLARQYAIQNNSDPSKKPINIDKTLENAFFNIHEASTNTDIRAKMSDRNDSLTKMDTVFKREKVPLKTTKEESEKSKTEKDKKYED